jgi:hypothetical protein
MINAGKYARYDARLPDPAAFVETTVRGYIVGGRQ